MTELCGLPHPELGWPCTEPAGHPLNDHDRSADVTSSSELPVPDAAMTAVQATASRASRDGAEGMSVFADPDDVRAIAGPVVAAVLREEADLVAAVSEAPEVAPNAGDIIARLRARADELEGRVSMR